MASASNSLPPATSTEVICQGHDMLKKEALEMPVERYANLNLYTRFPRRTSMMADGVKCSRKSGGWSRIRLAPRNFGKRAGPQRSARAYQKFDAHVARLHILSSSMRV